jgi:hypothetical protein
LPTRLRKEHTTLDKLAEGEELGSNRLHVGQRSGTKPSVLRCSRPARVWPDGIRGPQRATPWRFKRAYEPLAAGRNLPSWTLVGEVRICSPNTSKRPTQRLSVDLLAEAKIAYRGRAGSHDLQHLRLAVARQRHVTDLLPKSACASGETCDNVPRDYTKGTNFCLVRAEEMTF